MIELRKFQCGRRRLGQWRGPCCRPVWVRGVQADRSRRACAQRQGGFPRNLGDPVVSTGSIGRGYAEPKNPRPFGCASGTERNERPDAPRGTAARRQRRAAGWTTGSRRAVIVPETRGNGARPDPVEGSAASDHGPVAGTHGKCIEPWFRVNATATDTVSDCEPMVRGTVSPHACTYGSVGAPGE